MNEHKPEVGGFVDKIMWKRYNEDGYATIESKVHYISYDANKTICGASLPERGVGESEGTSAYVDCKKCSKMFDKLNLTDH